MTSINDTLPIQSSVCRFLCAIHSSFEINTKRALFTMRNTSPTRRICKVNLGAEPFKRLASRKTHYIPVTHCIESTPLHQSASLTADPISCQRVNLSQRLTSLTAMLSPVYVHSVLTHLHTANTPKYTATLPLAQPPTRIPPDFPPVNKYASTTTRRHHLHITFPTTCCVPPNSQSVTHGLNLLT